MCCLEQALTSLKAGTTRQLHTEVIVQGDLRANVTLPQNMDIDYRFNDRNLGNSIPVKDSIERFLDSDALWFVKWDDDMTGPPGFVNNLIACLNDAQRKGHKVGCAMIAPPKYLFAGVPRMKVIVKGNSLRWQQGSVADYKLGKTRYSVCDFADHGATVFSRWVLEAGVRPDTNLFVGGVDFDMCLQMLKLGYKSVLMTSPRCGHHHEECKPVDYGRVRYSYEQIQKSADYLQGKWGLEIRYLKKFKGGPWMEKKPKRPTGKNWHREAVAGKRWRDEKVWEAVGKLQLDFLRKQGMVPTDKLLDFGCGALRFGVHAAKYLRAGNYWGVDKETDLIRAGKWVEGPRYNVPEAKLKGLRTISDFDLSVLPRELRFDFAMAHSIITHLTIEDSGRLVQAVMRKMKPTGSFFATFHESQSGAIDESEELTGFQAWRKNERLLTVYPFTTMEKLAEDANCHVDYIGAWGHKYNAMGRQMMVRFYQKGSGDNEQ